MAAHQRRLRPDNEYLDVSQASIRRRFPPSPLPFGLATAVLRGAAGIEPSPTSERVRSWLTQQQGTFAPVMPFDPRERSCPRARPGRCEPARQRGADARTRSRSSRRASTPPCARRACASRSVGTMNRACSIARRSSPARKVRSIERRTIHLGLDIFCDAGTPVHAPLRGTVHAFAYNPASLDYGGVIVLRHTTDDEPSSSRSTDISAAHRLTGMTVGRSSSAANGSPR